MSKPKHRGESLDPKQIMRILGDKAYSPRQVMRIINLPSGRRSELVKLLQTLAEAGEIVRLRGGLFGLPKSTQTLIGRFHQTQPGFAFIIPEAEQETDLYVPARAMKDAMPDDRVEVRVQFLPSREPGRPQRRQAQVIRIVERSRHQVVGAIIKRLDGRFAIEPEGLRGLRTFLLAKPIALKARVGDKVVARILEWPQNDQPGMAEITEVLGAGNDAGVEITAIIRQYELPDAFSQASLQQAKAVSVEPDERAREGRMDLRHLPIVTIDGADARDFDDAVSCESLAGGGWRLGVHIADVSHYLKPDTSLDREARERGTSVYLPDRVLHMLPEALSCGVCSLVPDKDRLTMSAFMEITPEGAVEKTEFFSSVIHSHARLTYDWVQAVLEGSKEDNPAQPFRLELLRLSAVSQAIRKNREQRGSLDFDLPDAKVILGADGRVLTIEKRMQLASHKLIEDCMIAANEAVAQHLQRKDIPSLYRVHAQPAGEKLQELKEFLEAYGYVLETGKPKDAPKAFQRLLAKWQDKPEAPVLNMALLRSLKIAVYSSKNMGHFGLGSQCYTHFTSPIRRYPDLVVHRMLKIAIEPHPSTGEQRAGLAEQMPAWGDALSLLERRAMKAEREAVKLKQMEFAEGKIGELFSGKITQVVNYGFYVELLEHFLEGVVYTTSLRDDYYAFDEKRRILQGANQGRLYQPGQPVRIKIENVDRAQGRILFQLIPEQETSTMPAMKNPPRVAAQRPDRKDMGLAARRPDRKDMGLAARRPDRKEKERITRHPKGKNRGTVAKRRKQR